MKRLLFISALCLLFASCGGDKGPDGGGVPSLKVEPSSLDFAAVSAPSQSVTVTAVNVEWEVRVSDTASAWLKTEKTDGTTVTVSVTDNGTPEQRTGSFTVVPTNNEDVKAKSVTVVQTGGDVEYKFSVEPAALTFEAEGAAAQTVTITAEGGLTWEAEVEGDAASWITVTPGEGTLEVKVSDNPETAERSGNIVVTPSAESVGAKAIRVTQAGKVLPPSLSINVEDPETGFKFQASGVQYEGASNIQVTAVNTDWNARAVDADGNAITWLKITVNKNDGLSSINVDVSKLVYSYAEVNPNQDWEEADMGAGWYVYLYSEGLTEDNGVFTGTGTYIMLEMSAEHMGFNDDKEYYLSEGTYEIYTDESGQRGPQMTYTKGYPGYFDYQNFGSWALVVENGEIVEKGPCAAGTVTVSRSGDSYTFTLDIEDDMQYAVSGTTTVEFSRVKVLSDPVPQPPTGFQ